MAGSLTSTLSRRVLGAELDDAVVVAARRGILDGIAVALAGIDHESAPIVAEHVMSLGGAPRSSLLGRDVLTSPVLAAYANGVAMHVLDFEPMWDPPTHPVSTTLAAALAVAESEGASGRALLEAFVKGCEIQNRILLAAAQFSPRGLSFHPPGVVGILGAATAVGVLLGLNADRLAHALGIAASRAGSLIANVGSMTKSTHCGNAAAQGVDAGLLAQRGFTANPDVLPSFAQAFFRKDLDTDVLLGFGEPWRLVDPGLAIKLYPSQYGTHFAIEAAREVYALLDGGTIERVEIVTPPMPYVDRPDPKSGLDGKFSFQYVTAIALLDGNLTIDSFTDERRFAPDAVALLAKTVVVPDESIPSQFARMHVDVRARLSSGRVAEARCGGPRGSWGKDLAPEIHLEKVNACLSRHLTEHARKSVVAQLTRLEELNPGELRALCALLRGSA